MVPPVAFNAISGDFPIILGPVATHFRTRGLFGGYPAVESSTHGNLADLFGARVHVGSR
jgi:hypothetical protein